MNAYATFLIGATILLLLLIYVGTAVHKTKRLVGTLLIALRLAKDPRTIPQDERVLDTYFRRLLVYPLGKSRVIAIEFQLFLFSPPQAASYAVLQVLFFPQRTNLAHRP